MQRIAIARAIASSPRLLILDEANTAFDYASDLALANGLLSLKGRMTIVLITSRPSFAAIANRVFTLVDGKFQQIEPDALAAAIAAQFRRRRGMSRPMPIQLPRLPNGQP